MMLLIAGPCVLEEYDVMEETYRAIKKVMYKKDVDFYFKASCYKDNRTSWGKPRGVGFEAGVVWFETLRLRFPEVRICTDFHSASQIRRWGSMVDMIQIPAFLGRQVSLLEAAAEKRKKIHLKKPQFMSPEDIQIPLRVLSSCGVSADDIYISDRGTCFGYDKLIFDPRNIAIMRLYCDNVLVDITHPNKGYSIRLRNGIHALNLGCAAIAAGARGLFMEVHPRTHTALCDRDTMLSAEDFRRFFEMFYDLYGFVHNLRGLSLDAHNDRRGED